MTHTKLYQLAWILGSSTGDCTDSNLVDCQELDTVSNICSKITEATRYYCPKFCNICEKTVTTTTHVLTTLGPYMGTCTDNPIVNCTELDITSSICHPVTAATYMYCGSYCRACPDTSPTSTVTTTVATTTHHGTLAPYMGTCTDSPIVNCTELDITANICNPLTMATTLYCGFYCRACPVTTPTMTTPTQTTSTNTVTKKPQTVTTTTHHATLAPYMGTCTDSPIINCTELDITTNICNPITMATTLYCGFYCGACPVTTPTTTSTTKSTTITTTDMTTQTTTTTITTTPTTTVTTTTTSMATTTPGDPCADNPEVDCVGLDLTQKICSKPNNIIANRDCITYCGLCPV